MLKKRILIFTGFYLPGLKGGGPIRTISNLVSHLGDEFDFYIITSDHDLGDNLPYSVIEPNSWNQVGKAKVYYFPTKRSIFQLYDIINKINYDVIYLNSFFSLKFTIFPLLIRRFGKLKVKPIILAPRGEFANNALSLKKLKKSIFMKISNLLGIYNDIIWQASTLYEKNDITDTLKKNGILFKDVIICKDLPELNIVERDFRFDHNIVKICFLSRISEIKNLQFVLCVLKNISFPIYFGIYGPQEDSKYWDKCQKIIKQLPSNITVEVFGSVPNDQVRNIIASYDLFFVPSKGENYGHVFVEAFSAGTPVLVSDLTPWRNLHQRNIGWDISLGNLDDFSQAINKYYHYTIEEKQAMRNCCIQFAENLINDISVLDANRKLFNDLK